MESNNQKRRQRLKLCKERQHKRLRLRFRTWDRLSTLPDAIICEILSHLPINTAVSTSVLSRRWRYLWRGVSRVEYVMDGIVKFKKKKACLKRYINYDTGLYSIAKQLTCKKLQLFHLDLSQIPYHAKPKSELEASFKFITVESVFREVYDRNVEEFIFSDRNSILTLPDFLLRSPSLVTLNLDGYFTIEFPENAAVYLPNLKHLFLRQLFNLPTWLEPLFKSSPMLESFVLNVDDPTSDPFPRSITLFAPALTSLEIKICTDNMILNHTNFYIDAPKLSNLAISDNANFYYFLHDHCPDTLLSARLDLTRRGRLARDYFNPILVTSEGYFHQMSTFVRGMYAVKHLELKVDPTSNILPTLYSSANITDGVCPMFRNITSFTTSWRDIGINGWTYLLPLLHFFPYLNHLHVDTSDDILDKEWDFCPPDSVPNCMVSHLKTVNISVTYKVRFDANSLAAYILSHALVLEDLTFRVGLGYDIPNESLQLKQHDLRTSLFNLPKCSSCEVHCDFGPSITTSSSTYIYI